MAGKLSEKLLPAALQTYFKQTRSHFFGLLSILFLLVIYESSSASLYAEQKIQIRNSAEVMIERMLWFMGVRNSLLLWAVYLLILAWAFWLAKKQNLLSFKFVYIPYSIFESTLYALLLGLIAGKLTERTSLILQQGQEELATMGAKMTLAVGAGIYEELLFRFFLISLLILIFDKLAGGKRPVYAVLAVALAAILFSGFHYLGGREAFTFDSFIFRFYAGVILGMLFVLRGIGVTSYTHALYNLLLIFR
jgi:membrane protease YdiL (CAAX protease family)